ncbi:MAG: ABC transporter permease [Acidimicrobiales bacterium]
MNLESVTIALHGIIANKLRSMLTMLGILIGVASVIVLVAVGSGSAAASRTRLEALGSNTITVRAGGLGFGNRGGTQSRSIRIEDADVPAILDKNEAPSVARVAPIVDATAVAASYNGASTTPQTFQGTNDVLFTVRHYEIASGSKFTQEDLDAHAKVAVVGLTVAKNLLGEDANAADLIGESVKFGNSNLTVIGILKPKGTNGTNDQDNIVLAPLTTVRDLISGGGSAITQLVVQANSRKAMSTAQAEVTAILQSRHTGATTNSFLVQNNSSLLETQDANNKTFTVLLGAVAAISLLVGGIGVMNIMLVTVTERTREIGIRKAIGARRSDILGQFLTEAVLVSVLGGLLGVAGGLIGSRFKIVNVQPVVEPYSVFLAFGVAVVVGLFFGIYPANRAAQLRPIDALRYE